MANANSSHADLEGKLLIAMPGMSDPRFDKSVVFMCAHSEDGALGLIINKPTPELKFAALLEQLGLDGSDPKRDIQVTIQRWSRPFKCQTDLA